MNIELFEGQSCLVHVKLPEEWEVYGGTPKGEFRAERESADSVLVTVPAMEAEFTPLVPYELFARRILDGREWLVLSGQLHVRRRYSDAGGGVSAIEYFVEPQLVEDGISSSPQIIVGIPGPQGPKGDKGDPGEGGMTAEERALLNGAAQRGGANTFTASNTFTGSVDMSTAQVTPPSGWNVEGVTAEAIQAVVPIAWGGECVKFGGNGASVLPAYAVGVGSNVQVDGMFSSGIGGFRTTVKGTCSIALGGNSAKTKKDCAITIGSAFEDTAGNYECTTEGTGSITIGAGANTLNPTNADGTPVLDDKGKPKESSNSVTIGCKAATTAPDSVTMGAAASNTNSGSILIGAAAKSEGNKSLTITLGAQFTETSDKGAVLHTCTTEGTGSITIGAGANTKNNGTTESSNSVTIGCKASNSGADSVVIGAQASSKPDSYSQYDGSVVIGAGATHTGQNDVIIGKNAKNMSIHTVSVGAESEGGYCAVSAGFKSKSGGLSVAVGNNAEAFYTALALGCGAKANANRSTAVGYEATVSDLGATVIRSTAEDGTYTQLYFSGANTPLANTYHGGAPMLGYVTKDSAGNIVAAGTRSLIDLLTDNSTFAPASLDENGEWVTPKVFHPSDLDLPVEEPSEPEAGESTSTEVAVLEYTPLPVWPIVEPDDIMGDNGTLEQGDTENTSPETNS